MQQPRPQCSRGGEEDAQFGHVRSNGGEASHGSSTRKARKSAFRQFGLPVRLPLRGLARYIPVGGDRTLTSTPSTGSL